jgi:hypothetical protein
VERCYQCNGPFGLIRHRFALKQFCSSRVSINTGKTSSANGHARSQTFYVDGDHHVLPPMPYPIAYSKAKPHGAPLQKSGTEMQAGQANINNRCSAKKNPAVACANNGGWKLALVNCAAHPIIVRCGSDSRYRCPLGRFLPRLGLLALRAALFLFSSPIQF